MPISSTSGAASSDPWCVINAFGSVQWLAPRPTASTNVPDTQITLAPVFATDWNPIDGTFAPTVGPPRPEILALLPRDWSIEAEFSPPARPWEWRPWAPEFKGGDVANFNAWLEAAAAAGIRTYFYNVALNYSGWNFRYDPVPSDALAGVAALRSTYPALTGIALDAYGKGTGPATTSRMLANAQAFRSAAASAGLQFATWVSSQSFATPGPSALEPIPPDEHNAQRALARMGSRVFNFGGYTYQPAYSRMPWDPRFPLF